MRHATEGELRRLYDEPLAIPDRTAGHVARCRRCSARQVGIAQVTERSARLLSSPQLVPDVDAAWTRLERKMRRPDDTSPDRVGVSASVPRRHLRFVKVPVRSGLVIAAAGVVVAGAAAAVIVTTTSGPTHPAPVSLSQSDLQDVADFMGLGDSHVIGGFSTTSGSHSFPFGTIKWSSSGPARPVASLAQASAEAGFPVSLPSRLPAGVARSARFVVQPMVRATVIFSSTATGVAGSSVTLGAGPAVLVEYGSASGIDVPTLAVLTMPRPTAVSSGATMSEIEAFLLRQPGIPPELAEEVRLLGDLGTSLPVPVPQGASVRSVQVGGSPGVLVADDSDAAAGVIWENVGGTIHVVAGILDPQDVLNVADQIG